MADDQDHITAGSMVDGRFAVGPTVGSGAFGIVYRAEDLEPGDGPTLVALKTLRASAFSMPDLVERFAREAEICEVLVHPNIARLIHFGTVSVGKVASVPYMVMDLIRGLPLGGLVSMRGKLTAEETAHILAAVLDGLAVAHENGILHRDLKPNNILVEAPAESFGDPGDGKDLFDRLGVPGAADPVWQDLRGLPVKVVDFGLGKVLNPTGKQAKRLTRAGVAAGTAEYMSPEQVRAIDDIDDRADIYGVAMLMYRLLAGKTAYTGGSLFETAKKQLTEPLPPLPDGLDKHALGAVYRKAGAKERDDRYQSAALMAYALRKAIDPNADIPAPIGAIPPKRGFFSRLFRR